MFGLMRAKKCGMSADEKEFRRLNYCGTCKTIGSLYGQRSRLMLNHDTVFLAEMLTSLAGESVGDWQKQYQSYNCLSLPKTEMPISLQFAAAANVILAEFKIADHLEDSRQRRFKIAHRIFSKEFLKAENSLKEWNFPLEEVREILQTQEKREAAGSSLEMLAEPTARTTALFFSHGARLIGKPELANLASEIGENFGKLIYMLDAFEDFEKDSKTNQFNAFRSAFDLTGDKILPETGRKIAAILHDLENRIARKIAELPIDDRQGQIFISRLRQNLDRKLPAQFPVLKARKVCAPQQKPSLSERYRRAVETAGKFARNYSWQMPLVFLFVFIFALVAPAHELRETKSARECFDLSFNLMFLGAVFSSATASLKPLFLETPEGLPAEETATGTKGTKGKKGKVLSGIGPGGGTGRGFGRGNCCCCCCDCGDDCDCCCDCEMCSGCDGCSDCGDCDCGGCDC